MGKGHRASILSLNKLFSPSLKCSPTCKLSDCHLLCFYKDVITHKIEQELYRMNTLYNFYSTPGRIYVLDSSEVSPEEDILLNMIARLRFDTNKTALAISLLEIAKISS